MMTFEEMVEQVDSKYQALRDGLQKTRFEKLEEVFHAAYPLGYIERTREEKGVAYTAKEVFKGVGPGYDDEAVFVFEYTTPSGRKRDSAYGLEELPIDQRTAL
jgi:hypothetical protein